MESATGRTTGSRKFLSGLAKCVEKNVLISLHGIDLASWKAAKEKGERLFKAEHGGSYEVFNQRPIPEEFYTVLVMSCASLSCGIGSGKGPMVGETWSTKKPRSASRHLRNQSTSPTAQIGRWLRGLKTRIGLWMSGITSLLLATTSMKIGSTKIGTMTGRQRF
jgi:hypothetical protein